MTRAGSTALTAGLILLVAIAIHVDYHLGRGTPYPYSLDSPYHWILGLVTLAPVAWVVARLWPAAALTRLALVVGLGVFLGQIVEPWLETRIDTSGMAFGLDAERWRIFAEFMVAGVVGASVGYFLGMRRGLRAPGVRPGRI